jgi:EpsI family protein
MHRRDLIIGGACLLGAGAAFAAKPRRHVPLLKGGSLADLVPSTFGGWISEDVGDPLAINGPDSLSAKLYSQLVTRVYTNDAQSFQVMMLLAYGQDQTDDLQLHRPEVCYPAFGYALQTNVEIKLPVTGDVQLPARRLIAQSDERREGIIYWTRMGELLPASGREQREDRVRIAMQGIVPDGVLCRFSTTVSDPNDSWRAIQSLVPALLTAVAPKNRAVLIGTERANRMSKA